MLIWASLLTEIERAERAALVSVVRVFGSTPREAGARMVVTADRLIGTIGGGNLEWEAMQAARRHLADDAGSAPLQQTLILGPDLGQCCGGRIEIVTEIYTTFDRDRVTELAQREATGN